MHHESVKKRAGQLFVAGFEGQKAPAWTLDALREARLSGVILFSRNFPDSLEAPRVSRAINHQLWRAAQDADFLPLIGIDQEGGRVRRLKTGVSQFPPAREVANWTPREITTKSARLHQELSSLGFNLNFGPVLDVDSNPANPVIGDRSYGRSPDQVIACARAWAEGAKQAGVLSCGKHFPGHGDTDLDSHFDLPTVHHDLTRLHELELAPFRALTSLPSWMTAHIIFPAIDSKKPATLSKKCIDIARNGLGYDGVIFSDDMEMKALENFGSMGEIVIEAIAAGCDQILICHQRTLLEEAIEYVIREMEKSAAFTQRVEQALARVSAMRTTIKPLALKDDDV